MPDYYDETPREKRGHKYCFCCCDTRRAVVIVNGVSILMGLVGIILMALAVRQNNQGTLENNFLQEMFIAADTQNTTVVFTTLVFRMMFNLTGLLGALHYNTCMVGTCFVWYLIQAVFSGIAHIWGAMAVFFAFAYVHIFFIMEVNSGIMSPATYPVEKHSCCCNV